MLHVLYSSCYEGLGWYPHRGKWCLLGLWSYGCFLWTVHLFLLLLVYWCWWAWLWFYCSWSPVQLVVSLFFFPVSGDVHVRGGLDHQQRSSGVEKGVHRIPLAWSPVLLHMTQSMVRLNNSVDITHPWWTPDLTAKLVVFAPTEQEKLLENSWMMFTSKVQVPQKCT